MIYKGVGCTCQFEGKEGCSLCSLDFNGEEVEELSSFCDGDDSTDDAEEIVGDVIEFISLGWKCPNCGASNAPFVFHCPCSPPPPPTPWPPPYVPPYVPPYPWITPYNPNTIVTWGPYFTQYCSGAYHA